MTAARDAAPSGGVRAHVSPVTWLMIGATIPLTIVAMYFTALDVQGETLWGIVLFAAPTVAAVYTVLEVLWTGRGPASGMAVRMLLVPAISAVVSAVTIAITYALPPVQQALARTRLADGWHYWFDAEEGNPWLLSLLAGLFLGILAGLATWVFVVLPVTAIRKPREFAQANGAGPDDGDPEAIRRTSIGFALLIVMIFLIPTLIVVGAGGAQADDLGELFAGLPHLIADPFSTPGDLTWLIGILLIPVGIGLFWYVASAPGRARREAERHRTERRR